MKKYLLAPALALAAVVAIAPVASASAATTKQKHKAPTVRCHLEVKHGKKYVKTWTKCPKASSAASSVAGASGKDGVNGRDGKDGAQGPQGIPGLAGKDGVSGYEVRTWDYIKSDDYPGVGPGAIATVACSSQSKVAISGGWFMRNGNATDGSMFDSQALSNGAGVTASFPGRMNWDTNTPKPNRYDGWIVQFNKQPAGDVTLYVVCVNAA